MASASLTLKVSLFFYSINDKSNRLKLIPLTDSHATCVACSTVAPRADTGSDGKNDASPKTTANASSKLRLFTLLKALKNITN